MVYDRPTDISTTIYPLFFEGGDKNIEWTVCLTLNYHLDLEMNIVKYALCTLCHVT